MSRISLIDHLFENVKFSEEFSKKIADMIEVYFFVWLLLQILFWVMVGLLDIVFAAANMLASVLNAFFGSTFPTSVGLVDLIPLLTGFSLFTYLPYWLRIILLVYIADGIISIPIAILVFIAFAS